uniref:NADH-ubiquinone oxidoreductase chain 2 n=1 Tax=Eupelmus anpingensis TaxID=2989843 RepID=A0A9E7V2X5_9HYME|nr:NADH dehydrogenase subunit 2 [Eupelmus anpingensis]UYR45777.1 NADH dehydrogenase subunit 2 [Eupelmus anpingensis]
MYLNFYCYMIFMPMILFSNMISIFLMSWMSLWMLMEINLISFIMLLIFDKFNNYKISMNYFLIQTFNSYLFLFSSIMLNFNDLFSLLIFLTMLTKLGMPPFHYWYIKTIKKISWNNVLMLLTIQKIIPLIVISMVINKFNTILNFNLLIMISMTFSMIYSIMGINLIDIKVILAYSSIIQMSWILLVMMNNETLSMTYFLIYCINSLNLISLFKKMNFTNLMNFNSSMLNKKMTLFLFMSILSLASMPPYFGFMMKWISIWSIFKNINIFLIIWMIFISLISMFFYIRIIINSIYSFSISKKNHFKKINFYSIPNWWISFTNWMILFLLNSYELF